MRNHLVSSCSQWEGNKIQERSDAPTLTQELTADQEPELRSPNSTLPCNLPMSLTKRPWARRQVTVWEFEAAGSKGSSCSALNELWTLGGFM